jgi:hypothetical protein
MDENRLGNGMILNSSVDYPENNETTEAQKNL